MLLTPGQKPKWATIFLLVVSPHNQSRKMFSSTPVGFLFWFLWRKTSKNLAWPNICFYKWTSLRSDFPTKLTLVPETINHWLTAATNPLRIYVMKQKHSNNLRRAAKDRKLKRQQAGKVELYIEKRSFEWKQRTSLYQSAHTKANAAPKDSHSGERSGDGSHRMVPRHRK